MARAPAAENDGNERGGSGMTNGAHHDAGGGGKPSAAQEKPKPDQQAQGKPAPSSEKKADAKGQSGH